MSFNFKHHHDNLLFIPLGGTNEIGINVNLYHYKGKWLMVDCGSGFADEYLPGVDMIIADLAFIERNKRDLLGIVITHAHEDHIGAIQYVWNSLKCPIYATTFTANFLKIRLKEHKISSALKIHEVKPRSTIALGPFSIELFNLTHSAPEMQGMMIRTDVGNILHTGDWKLDPTPVIGPVSDEISLKSYGDEGVLALVCDSTNVFNRDTSGSEGALRQSLVDLIAGCTKMVVVTTFASNLARVDSIIYAAKVNKRKVALSGKSLHRMLLAAQTSGYLDDVELINEQDIGKYNRNEVLVIATGCQGEPLAAINKIANNTHNTIKLAPQDTVIFSSKIIPGNEKKIFRLFNILIKSKIEILTERDHFVHVSGHPGIEDLKKMYSLVRPQICIPVHGETSHIHEHAKFAKKCGISHTVEVSNGDVVLLEAKTAKVVHRVQNGYLAVDGNYLLPSDAQIFKMRRKIREDGIIVVSIFTDQKYWIIGGPIISTPGILDPEEDVHLINALKAEVLEILMSKQRNPNVKMTKDDIINLSKSTIKRIIKQEMNKYPVIIVNVDSLNKK